MPVLTIGYSTLSDRRSNIQLPANNDWEYQFHIQGATKTLDEKNTFYLQGKGVAKSRNNALDQASGTYLLFGDDDVVFDPAQLELAIEYLNQHPELSLLLVAAKDETGQLRKNYPKKPTKLTRFNSARAATYEMIVRVEAVKALGVRFDEDFGAGAKNYLGDEYIFIADLLKAGGKADFAPFVIATHPSESSGSRWGKPEDRQARAKVFTRVFGALAPLIRIAFAARRIKEFGGIRNAIRFVVGS